MGVYIYIHDFWLQLCGAAVIPFEASVEIPEVPLGIKCLDIFGRFHATTSQWGHEGSMFLFKLLACLVDCRNDPALPMGNQVTYDDRPGPVKGIWLNYGTSHLTRGWRTSKLQTIWYLKE